VKSVVETSGTWCVDTSDAESIIAAKASAMAFLRARGEPAAPYEDCGLALGELLSNAVRHAEPGAIDVRLDWSADVPVLEVTNVGDAFPVRLEPPETYRESGRGLFIIAQIADVPRVASSGGRCTVSVSLPVSKAPA
jgi:anti-sigma regulatory factor (Ser/Thr protein kinase)